MKSLFNKFLRKNCYAAQVLNPVDFIKAVLGILVTACTAIGFP